LLAPIMFTMVKTEISVASLLSVELYAIIFTTTSFNWEVSLVSISIFICSILTMSWILKWRRLDALGSRPSVLIKTLDEMLHSIHILNAFHFCWCRT
jgi:hypothetical protein